MFTSADLATLLETTLMTDPAAARAAVDNNESAAAIFVPAGFTASIIPSPQQSAPAEIVQIEFYANPHQPHQRRYRARHP